MMNLKNSELHIWWTNLDQSPGIGEKYLSFLTESEINKINNYKTQLLRNRQIVSKAILKKTISEYLNIDILEIEYSLNKYGKPFLNKSLNHSSLNFNISHSENIGIFAFSLDDIGIDVEKIKEISNLGEVKEITLTDFEQKWYNNLDKEVQTEIFYKVWTIKEAFLKAIGKGFSFSPLNIELTNEHEKQIQIKNIYSKDLRDEAFHVKTISILPDFVTSIVYQGQKRIKIFPMVELRDFKLVYQPLPKVLELNPVIN
jgi:4'-phosphopantetheinyl transferase